MKKTPHGVRVSSSGISRKLKMEDYRNAYIRATSPASALALRLAYLEMMQSDLLTL